MTATGSANAVPALRCAGGAITCVTVEQAGAVAALQPVTFGQAFRQGDVPRGTGLRAADSAGTALPLQLDARATYPDGSLRFAVLSTLLPHMGKGERRRVDILRGAAAAAPPPAPPAPFALTAHFSIYAPQITIVKFGNRNGHTPGIPFKEGENITLHVGNEAFSLTVTPKMAGGDYTNYQAIAQAFAALIGKQSKAYRARWNGAEAGFEEDLWLSPDAADTPFSVKADYGGAAKISFQPYQKLEPREDFVASLGKETGNFWLNGPVATERDVVLPLIDVKTGKPHPLLEARVHLRRYPAAGAVRADFIVENDWAYAPNPHNVTYDIEIRRGNEVVYRHDRITHTHHARWHTVIWSEGRAEPVVREDVPYLIETGVVPPYMKSVSVSQNALESDAKWLAAVDTAPMGTAAITLYMPTTGMRPDIGPLPQWGAQYLLSMDDRARALTFANADAGGSMPIHYRDRATDLPISLDRHPGVTLMFGRPRPADAVPPVIDRTNPWTLDAAHHPSLFYLPYLISGDLYYLEEITFYADWVMAIVDPGLRGYDKGLLWGNQVRATAWSLRTLGEAAVILPDAHPMKAYFNAKLQNNLAYYLDHFARNSSPLVSPLGILENVDQNGTIGPWQYDFFFLSVGDLARAGIPNAAELARWMARFVVGRWSREAEEEGYCHQMAPAYYVKFRDPQGRPYADWGALFRANWPDAKSCPRDFIPDSGPGTPDGYVANSYAALGVAALLGIPGALQEHERIGREMPAMLYKFNDDPTFAIGP